MFWNKRGIVSPDDLLDDDEMIEKELNDKMEDEASDDKEDLDVSDAGEGLDDISLSNYVPEVEETEDDEEAPEESAVTDYLGNTYASKEEMFDAYKKKYNSEEISFDKVEPQIHEEAPLNNFSANDVESTSLRDLSCHFKKYDLVMLDMENAHIPYASRQAVIISENFMNEKTDYVTVAMVLPNVSDFDNKAHVIVQWYDDYPSGQIFLDVVETIRKDSIIKYFGPLRIEDSARVEQSLAYIRGF